MYHKYVDSKFTTACKGVSKFHKQMYLENFDHNNVFNKPENLYKLNTHNIMSDREDNIIVRSTTKIMGMGLIPTKRYFESSGHSKTFQV